MLRGVALGGLHGLEIAGLTLGADDLKGLFEPKHSAVASQHHYPAQPSLSRAAPGISSFLTGEGEECLFLFCFSLFCCWLGFV